MSSTSTASDESILSDGDNLSLGESAHYWAFSAVCFEPCIILIEFGFDWFEKGEVMSALLEFGDLTLSLVNRT